MLASSSITSGLFDAGTGLSIGLSKQRLKGRKPGGAALMRRSERVFVGRTLSKLGKFEIGGGWQ